jgi:hypothetical protein
MGLIRLINTQFKIEAVNNYEHSLFDLTPTRALNVEDSPSPLHVERGGGFSEHRRLSRGEVVTFNLS